jgi:hypothetical protein
MADVDKANSSNLYHLTKRATVSTPRKPETVDVSGGDSSQAVRSPRVNTDHPSPSGTA